MTNKNGSVVPAAQELETFLPVDTVNGVTKWVLTMHRIKSDTNACNAKLFELEKRETKWNTATE